MAKSTMKTFHDSPDEFTYNGDWLAWRANAKAMLDEHQFGGWVLVSPIHTPCGKPHMCISMKAQVPQLIAFLDEWAANFGTEYTIEIEAPQWPRRYAIVFNHPDFPEGQIVFPEDDNQPPPSGTVH